MPAPRGTAPVPTSVGVPARSAWAESAARLRASTATEPGRLRIIGAALAVLVLAFGAVAAWQVNDRANAADNVVNHSARLSDTAARIYSSLADADAAVAGGFLVGGQQPADVYDQYTNDITTAATLITEAAENSGSSTEVREQITRLNTLLPQYTDLIATALADNRQGLPVGGAYLRYANAQMRQKASAEMHQEDGLLESAKKLYQIENDRLAHDYSDAEALPWVSWAVGGAALVALAWAQRRHYRRTNRVFNRGMLAASVACALALVWLAAGHTISRTELQRSWTHGGHAVQVINGARIEVLNARGDENLTLVARGAGDQYNKNFNSGMTTLLGSKGELAAALGLAHAGHDPVSNAIRGTETWRTVRDNEHDSDSQGDYATAVAIDIGGKDSKGHVVPDGQTTRSSFDNVDKSLKAAAAQEQKEFADAAGTGRDALTLLPFGAALLAVLGAAGAVLGISRRLSEYR